MDLRKYLGRAAVCLSALLFTACEDPTNVGEDLVGGIEGQPEIHVVPADSFEVAQSRRDVTSFRNRVLAGRVADPSLGTINAVGYMDFNNVSGVSNDFRNATSVTSAQLRMVVDYVYGDTTATVRLRLNQLADSLRESGVRADTTIAVGTPVTEFEVSQDDTLITVDLPSAFLTANSAALRSATFSRDFRGFSIEGVSEEAVFGFQPRVPGQTTIIYSIFLRVVAGGDTVNYPVDDYANTISRSGTPNIPPDRVLLQDGISPAVHVDFDLTEEEGLRSAAINRSAMSITRDTLSLITPPNFHRPAPRLLLYAELPQGDQLVAAFLYTGGRYLTGRGTTVDQLAQNVQQTLLGNLAPRRYRIEANEADNTISPALFYTPSASDLNRPQVRLTLTPTL